MTDPRFDELQSLAVGAQGGGGTPVSLAFVWQELTSGRTRIVHTFFTEQHYFLILTDGVAHAPQTVPRHRLRALDAVLSSGDIKSAAFALAVSPSAVSQSAGMALRQLGLECTTARVPVLVASAAHAARTGDAARSEHSAVFVSAGRSYRAVWAHRPEDRLVRVLTPAEHAVVRGLMEGRPHATIARRRGTSARTVANQLGAAFRRLGVSGRGSLVQYLVDSSAPRELPLGFPSPH